MYVCIVGNANCIPCQPCLSQPAAAVVEKAKPRSAPTTLAQADTRWEEVSGVVGSVTPTQLSGRVWRRPGLLVASVVHPFCFARYGGW